MNDIPLWVEIYAGIFIGSFLVSFWVIAGAVSMAAKAFKEWVNKQ